MKRRQFIGGLAGAAAWPVVARAQQSAMPAIGFLRGTPSSPFPHIVLAFREGLNEEGFVENQNVAIEYRYADNQLERLPALASDLIDRKVAAIVCNNDGARVARAITATIPIVFVTGEDPIRSGLVVNLNRPTGNLTGVTFFGGSLLNASRLKLLQELVPSTNRFAVLGDINYPAFEAELPNVVLAAQSLGRQIEVVKVTGEQELGSAFTKIAQSGAGALLVSGSPLFTSQRHTITALAARHAIPAIYDLRELVSPGGLISYSASFSGTYRQAGVYAGRIIKGAKPSELPVVQPTTFELVVNLKTAKALGLTVPPTLLARADEVIE